MRTHVLTTLASIVLALIVLGGAAPANAAQPFFLGAWQITGAHGAPWASGPSMDESKTLLGRVLTFAPDKITGPGILACPKLLYKLVESPPEGLFQGAFDEMHRKNAAFDPGKLAAAEGFGPPPFQTLQTGCANEIDFHFITKDDARFALSNVIYEMKRQPAP